MGARIRFYKRTIERLDYISMRAVISNSRLTSEEREAVTLADLEENPNKISANIMHTTERQFNRWLHSARTKITKQLFR